MRTPGPDDVVVRRGARTVFRYRVDGPPGPPVAVALRISRGGRTVMTVHLGLRRPGTELRQKLLIPLAPGMYTWSVIPDRLSEVPAPVARLAVA